MGATHPVVPTACDEAAAPESETTSPAEAAVSETTSNSAGELVVPGARFDKPEG